MRLPQLIGSNMRVYLNTTPLQNANRVRGVGKYTQDLVAALKFRPDVELVDKSEIADIIHYPFFDLFFHTLAIRRTKPTIVTIHDVIPLVLKDYFPVGIKGSVRFFVQKLALRFVSAVITSSESAKHDILHHLPVKPNKVFVAYQSVSAAFKQLNKMTLSPIAEKYHLPEKFILYVGDVNYNKNIVGLVNAFGRVQNKSCHLVLVGSVFTDHNLAEARQIDQAIAEHHVGNLVHKLGFVQDDELPAIYNLALAYIQPSFYEGFGRPVLEAMACGTPVLSANTSSLPEVYGDAALPFDPNNTDTIAQAIDKLLTDEQLRKDLITKGFSQIKKFTKEQFANSVAQVYQTVYNQNH